MGTAILILRRWTTCWLREEVPDEPRVAGEGVLVHVDAHLVVADKPHFLPVVPAGRFVRETLVERLGNPHLVPLHRIDRDTAGLVLFSADTASRARYSPRRAQ